MSIREISRRTGLSRNTVKKYLRSDEAEPTYAKRISPSKLDPYAEKLATWLGIEAKKSRKQRRNLKQIYTLGKRGAAARLAAA
jgi:transposase